jgi:hypothetical protein
LVINGGNDERSVTRRVALLPADGASACKLGCDWLDRHRFDENEFGLPVALCRAGVLKAFAGDGVEGILKIAPG